MIPKVIHFCWFGGNPISDEAKKCIESWKKYCPDYKIIEWNEETYDVTKSRYMNDAFNEKKWAFVSDYARVDIIYHYGGIYMDTDVELIKPLDTLLDCDLYGGWESRDDQICTEYENSVNFGLGFGAVKGHPVLRDILRLYDTLSFYNSDGSMNLVACPHYQTLILKKYGIDDSKRTMQCVSGIMIYPEDYFSPKSQITGEIRVTENTVSIHHFSMTWQDPRNVRFQRLEWNLTQYVGYKKAHCIVRVISLPYRAVSKIRKILGNSKT